MNAKSKPSYWLEQTRKNLSYNCGFSNRELGESQAVMLSVNRDSSALDRSNFEVIKQDLEERLGSEDCEIERGIFEDLSGWHIERFSHWACGWIDYIVVSAYSYDVPTIEDDKITLQALGESALSSEAFYIMENWILRLDDYPIAGESHFSELESNELYDYLLSEVESLRRRNKFTSRAPKSDSLIVSKIEHTSEFERGVASCDDIRGDMIESALKSLGYMYKSA